MTEKIDRRRREYLDPEWARERAIKGGRARTTLDYHVREVANHSRELTPDMIDKLRALLPPVKNARASDDAA